MNLREWERFWEWLKEQHRNLHQLVLSPYDRDYEEYLENMRKDWMKQEGLEEE